MKLFSAATIVLALLGAAVGADVSTVRYTLTRLACTFVVSLNHTSHTEFGYQRQEAASSSSVPEKRSLIGTAFSEQVNEAHKKGDEEVATDKKNQIVSKSSGSLRSNDKSLKMRSSSSYKSASLSSSGDTKAGDMQGLCNPNHTAGEDQDICEDLFTTLCNPDDILPADYEFCDWVGFTADVDSRSTRNLA